MHILDPLIHTKLHQPFTRPELVARPRLTEQFLRGLNGPLTLITAPAGFGKTTLVASGLQQCGLQTAWLSLDKEDNQIGRFLTYLIASIHHADDRIGVTASQLMAGLQPASPEAIVTSLINDLTNLHENMVLVLDDYHLITSAEVHEAMTFLVDHQPGILHLVIASRSDPAIPLARLRARGQIMELRGSDLRFTSTETSQFLSSVMGLQLDDTSVHLLEERTEGWIAGLQMAALSMRDRKDIDGFLAGFSGTNRYILDYLLEEVLANQSVEIQQFLLRTSILEKFCGPFCDALRKGSELQHHQDSGKPHISNPEESSGNILSRLDRQNLFLVSLDDDRTWYRFHHLFSDLLRARLEQTHPDLIPDLHHRAAIWLKENGFIPDAIQHHLAAREIEDAADLIEQYSSRFWEQSDISIILAADRLPPEVLATRPKIGLYRAWLYINKGTIDKAYPLLLELNQSLLRPDIPEDQLWVRLLVRLALAFLSPPGLVSTGPLPDQAEMECIPKEETVLRDAADILYGMTLGRHGRIAEAAVFAEQSIRRQQLIAGQVNAIPSLVPFLATIQIFLGKLHAAYSLSREYLEVIREKGIRVSTAGNMDVVLGGVLYEWNRLDEAEQSIRDGLAANAPWGNIMTDAFGMFALIKVLQSKGRYDEALQIVDRFEAKLQGLSRPVEFDEPVRTARARIWLARGDLRSASEWADLAMKTDDYLQHPDLYRLTIAAIRCVRGQYQEVIDILSHEPSELLHGSDIIRMIEINLLRSLAEAGLGDIQTAIRTLDACLAIAEPEGFVRIFVDYAENVRPLLEAYLRSDRPKHALFAKGVWIKLEPQKSDHAQGSTIPGLLEPLSARELEVLQWMAAGKTNQEIAGHLVVARGTIKAHAANIFRKLDASNRTEAVANARRFGLIP